MQGIFTNKRRNKLANEEYLSPESESSTELTESAPSTLAIITQSEYAAMVATANLQSNKRNVTIFGKRLMEYSTHSQPVALSMFYTLPRAGKQIVGPSVRFAEVVAPCWKNNSTGSRMIGATNDTVTAQGVFVDYEANTRNVKEIPRKITGKDGGKFNADMILTTSKAALSIAYREAVLKGGVPGALWDPAYQQAKLTAVGQAVSHAARVDAAMEYLNKLGVSEWQILNSVGVTSIKELEIDHLVTLKTLCEEIKKGARTIEEVFGSPFDKEIESLFTQMGKNETEKRLLRQSYMGRAKDLVEYLRGRVNAGSTQGQPVGQKQAAPQQTASTEDKPQATTQAEQVAQQETKQASQATTEQTQPTGDAPKRGRGRPSREEIAAREAAKKAAEAQGSTQESTAQEQDDPDDSEDQEQHEETHEAEPQQAKEEVPESGKFSF